MSEIEALYVFAYGSLIWRPDFIYSHKSQVVADGYERRFWQASHDHRGTPAQPGRVVTLVPIECGRCEGVIYALPIDGRENILTMLDEREQDGYERAWVEVSVGKSENRLSALTWIASENNPSWVGEGSAESVAQLIAQSEGSSGTNRDYLFRLHQSLIGMDIHDPHINQLVAKVQSIVQTQQDDSC